MQKDLDVPEFEFHLWVAGLELGNDARVGVTPDQQSLLEGLLSLLPRGRQGFICVLPQCRQVAQPSPALLKLQLFLGKVILLAPTLYHNVW